MNAIRYQLARAASCLSFLAAGCLLVALLPHSARAGSTVEVDRIEPWYGQSWPEGSTRANPRVFATLRTDAAPELQVIELWIDGQIYASWFDGLGSADYVRGDGSGSARLDDQDPSAVILEYVHSSYPRDFLAVGSHVLRVRFLDPNEGWIELSKEADWATFRVDNKATSIR